MYGREYFEGNLLEMLTIILQQVSLSFNSLSSSIGYCKKLQHYENTYNTLTEELKTEITNNKTLKIGVLKLQQENDLLRKSLKQENLNMMYECVDCGYNTNKKFNFDKHKNRKTSCKRTTIPSDLNVSSSNPTLNPGNLHVSFNDPNTDSGNHKIHLCSKCQKTFSNSSNLKRHQKICKNVRNPLQCKICLKIFSSPQSKYNHKKKVNCSPPPIKQPQTAFIINNNTNIDMITPMQ